MHQVSILRGLATLTEMEASFSSIQQRLHNIANQGRGPVLPIIQTELTQLWLTDQFEHCLLK